MLIFIICTILLEKITGSPSGPLAIINLFQKSQRTDTHPFQTNTQTGYRAENSPNKGLILCVYGVLINLSI